MGDNSDKKQIWVTYFFQEESIYEISKHTIRDSKLMLCIRKQQH